VSGRGRSRPNPPGLGFAGGRDVLWALPLLLAGAYMVLVAIHLRPIITSINADSDVSVAPVLARLWGEAPPHSHVVLGNHPWYEPFLLLRATSGLPFYRQLCDVSGMALSLAGLAVLAWSAHRALGRWAASLVVAGVLCVGITGRFMFLSLNWHSLSAVHTVVLGAALGWAAGSVHRVDRTRLVELGIVVGLATAPAVPDPVFPYWGLLPFGATVVLAAWRGGPSMRRGLLPFGVTVITVALVGGALLDWAMRDSGVETVSRNVSLVQPGRIASNAGLLVRGYMGLGGGDFLGEPVSAAVLVSGVLVLAALALAMLTAWRWGVQLRQVTPAGSTPVDQRFFYVTFWTVCLLVTSGVYLLSSAPDDVRSSRFLLAGYVAAGALVPVVALRANRWRRSLTAGVCVFAAVASFQVSRQEYTSSARPFTLPGLPRFPGLGEADALAGFARRHHVSYGYAGYWDAANLTWFTNFRLTLFPAKSCPRGRGLCMYPVGRIDSWYRPHPHTRSLLVVDPRFAGPHRPGRRVARPILTRTVGLLRVYVYAFDVATK
jgi:hypothetical protein